MIRRRRSHRRATCSATHFSPTLTEAWIPAPTARERDLVPVAPPAQVAAKLAVWQAWRASGISKSELARRLGLAEGEARRILDPDHPTSLPRLEAALHALGKQIVLSVA
jgi:antitoxin HicB